MRREWRRGGERRTLKTRRCPTSADAVVACTDPKMFRTAGERAAFDRVADRARLTRWGGDCYAYCLLAMGLIDIVIEASLYRLRRAGADADRERGGRRDHHVERRSAATRAAPSSPAATAALHAEVLALLAAPAG